MKLIGIQTDGQAIRQEPIVGTEKIGGVVTVDELLDLILSIIPTAEIGSDNDGQLIVYTNMKIVDRETTHGLAHMLVPFPEDEDREQDNDPDFYENTVENLDTSEG